MRCSRSYRAEDPRTDHRCDPQSRQVNDPQAFFQGCMGLPMDIDILNDLLDRLFSEKG